jgi:hypothetical protein
MAKEMKPVDITHTPDVLRLAEEVARSGIPYVLKKDNKDVAELRPVSSTPSRSRRRGKPTSQNDPLWRIVGMADADAPKDLPADISSNVDKYLADAYDASNK